MIEQSFDSNLPKMNAFEFAMKEIWAMLLCC